MADRLGIDTIDREGRVVVLKFRPQAKVDPVRLVALVRQRPELTLVPPAALKLNLDGVGGSGPGTAKPAEKLGAKPSSPQPPAHGSKKSGSRSSAAPSWWVARAKESEVKPGFTKAEMTRSAKEDPRAPGGIFERVGGLLSDLLDQGR
jgi:hypothetical protein